MAQKEIGFLQQRNSKGVHRAQAAGKQAGRKEGQKIRALIGSD